MNMSRVNVKMESDLGQTASGTEHKISPHLGEGTHVSGGTQGQMGMLGYQAMGSSQFSL